MPLRLIGIFTFLVGLVFRYQFILNSHHPRHHVYSDAAQYLHFATQLLTPGFKQDILNTVWPPGTPFILSLLYMLDPTLGVAGVVSLVLSALVPVLVAVIAKLIFGSKAAWWALIAASVHFGFAFYGGYFLSESFFIFLLTLGLALYAVAFTAVSLPMRVIMSALAGVTWGCAFSVRAAILPGLLIWVCFHLAYYLRTRRAVDIKILVVSLVAFSFVLIPLAVRCTALSGGRACLVANNFAMNVALGFAYETGVLMFSGPDRRLDTVWKPPSKLIYGYQKVQQVPADIFDTRGVFEWVGAQIRENPQKALATLVSNVFDLFNPYFAWPQSYGNLSGRQMVALQQLFLFFVLIPGLFGFLYLYKLFLNGALDSSYLWCLLSLVTGLLVVSAVSLGEPRYRIPFDVAFILFAVSFLKSDPKKLNTLEVTFLGLMGIGVSLVLFLGVLLLSPGNSLRPLALKWFPKASGPEPVLQKEYPLSLVKSFVSSDAAASPKSVVLTCDPACEGIRFNLGDFKGRDFSLGTDSNDYYQIRLYSGEDFLGSMEYSPHGYPQTESYHLRPIRIPEQFESSTITSIVVRPLFGDGNYHLGPLWAAAAPNPRVVPQSENRQFKEE